MLNHSRKNKGNKNKPKNLCLLNKFFLSVTKEMWKKSMKNIDTDGGV